MTKNKKHICNICTKGITKALAKQYLGGLDGSEQRYWWCKNFTSTPLFFTINELKLHVQLGNSTVIAVVNERNISLQKEKDSVQ